MKKTILNLRKNKKGMTAIEMVIGVIIFLIVLSFMLDIMVLFWKFSVVSQTATQVARITGIQGGALTSAPQAWPSADGYMTIHDLNTMVQDKMDSADVENWTMTIHNGRIGTQGVSSTSQIDYKDSFTVNLTIDYKWKFVSNFIPGMDITQSISAKRPAMSEWKYNYGNWNGG